MEMGWRAVRDAGCAELPTPVSPYDNEMILPLRELRAMSLVERLDRESTLYEMRAKAWSADPPDLAHLLIDT